MSLCALTHCLLKRPEAGADAPEAFEVHVTVAPLLPARLSEFRAACRALGVKALVLDLGQGVPQQPMTCSRVTGPLLAAHAEAERVASHLAPFGVTRRKIEAAPWNPGLPLDGPGYYEHHARVLLEGPQQEAVLRALCRELGLHLSHNPLKRLEGRVQQRFVTLRHNPMSPALAQQTGEKLWALLRGAGFTVEKTILEFCVYDSNRTLDAGWERAG